MLVLSMENLIMAIIKKILLEYVSTNPTGPIHVGHGRGAAYGSILANLLLASGYDVTREYYVNDTGRQMDILTISVWLRLLQNYTEKEIPFPSNAYHGQYITNIANRLYEKDKGLPVPDLNELLSIINEHAEEDIKLDRIITLAKSTLKNDYNDVVFTSSLNEILTDIKQDLEEFGVTFDNWFSEKSLVDSGDIKTMYK